ncbi:hypothetical protein J5N97_020502 [Dioscorea zingiberensis]|uniref:GYF domain-containing protein n=1 Tax=Dioscorea zingiberensis TaxID=325984 RepID=A0A9D5HDU1_9LILI|nr:hypothetical protein J5N97_020502 [Dioscorea zingiberensis]
MNTTNLEDLGENAVEDETLPTNQQSQSNIPSSSKSKKSKGYDTHDDISMFSTSLDKLASVMMQSTNAMIEASHINTNILAASFGNKDPSKGVDVWAMLTELGIPQPFLGEAYTFLIEQPKKLEVDTSGGNNEMRGILGSATEHRARDQATLDNIMPLSPQWLHVKPTESKTGMSAASGRITGVWMGHMKRKIGDEMDLILKVFAVGMKRRGKLVYLVGENAGRKEINIMSTVKVIAVLKMFLPENLWIQELQYHLISHEITNRTSAYESRRDSKWSSRWGPEEKEDSRSEKRTNLDKEDACVERQSSIGTNILVSESDSRDKWRPRHRQDAFSGGSSGHCAATGGRGEGSIVGFALGRGRSNDMGTSLGRFPAIGPIGATSANKSELHGKSGLSTETFRYPRGKLLDLYRKQKALVLIDTIPVGLEDVPSITRLSSIEPLAFVTPDVEEKITYGERNIISSEVCSDLTRCNFGKVDKQEIERTSNLEKCKAEINIPTNEAIPGGMTSSVVKEAGNLNNAMQGCSHSEPEQIVSKTPIYANGRVGDPSFLRNAKVEDMNSELSIDDSFVLPDDSNSLFDASLMLKTSQSDPHHQYIDNETEQSKQTPEELSFFYRDPHGDIQGPFLGVDIVSWFEQGFFGADLPVCLADAPEGTPFIQLGEVMPYLTHKSQTAPAIFTSNGIECSINLEGSTLSSGFTDSCVTSDQQWTSIVLEEPQVQPEISKLDTLVTPQYERLGLSNSETTDIISTKKHDSHKSAEQDVEVVLYSGRPFSCSDNSSGKLRLRTSQIFPKVPSANYMREKDLDEPLNPIDDPSVHDAWPGKFSRGTDANVAHNALHMGDLRHMESEPTQFSLKEQLLNQQLQSTQLPQHQLLPPHERLHLTGTYVDQVHGSVQHKLLNNQFLVEAENLLKHRSQPKQFSQQFQHLKHQFDHQQHIQEFQQLQQLCDQQLHTQQFKLQQMCNQQQLRHDKLQLLQHLRQQQQEEKEQILLEQLLHQQLCDPGFQASHINPLREEKMLEVLSRRHLFHEMQQHSQHLPMQSKFEHKLDEHQENMFHAVSYANHGEMFPMEQLPFGLQQEPPQTWQFNRTLQSWPDMGEDRHIDGMWSVDESGQLVWVAAHPRHIQSTGPSSLDFLQDQGIHQGPYVPTSESLERFIPLSANIVRPNTDLVNILPQVQRLGIHGLHDQTCSSAQMVQFPSAVASQQNLIKSRWSDTNDKGPQNFIESQPNQLSLEGKHQNRDLNFKFNHQVEDALSCATVVGNDEISRLRSKYLLEQNLALQSSQYSGLANTAALPSYETKEASWSFSGSIVDHSYLQDEVCMGSSFSWNRSHLHGVGHSPQGQVERVNNTYSNHGELEANIPIKHASVITSGGSLSSNYGVGVDDAFPEDMVINRISAISFEEGGDSLVKASQGPRTLSSQGSFAELGFSQPTGEKNLSKFTSFEGASAIDRFGTVHSEATRESALNSLILGFFTNICCIKPMTEGRRESGGNRTAQVPEGYTRSSHNIASHIDTGTLEAAFIGKLKSTKKPAVPEADATFAFAGTQDAGSVGQISKKKGKKGKQIDPSLLGFKVHSNRILKGEIQHLAD